MSVYVDQLVDYGWRMRGRKTKSCHMIADTLDELHAMAETIGLKREWFQPKSFPHYDLTPRRRAQALAEGVIACDRRRFVGHLQRIREAQ